MEHIILDTNFLLVPQQFDIAVPLELQTMFGACQLYTLDVCLDELKAKQLPQDRLPSVTVIETEGGKPDDLLVAYGQRGYTIATNDKALRQRLHDKNVSVIFVRQGRYLVRE